MVGGDLNPKTEFHLKRWRGLLRGKSMEYDNHMWGRLPFIVYEEYLGYLVEIIYTIELCHDVIYYLESGRKRRTYTRLLEAIDYMENNPYNPIPSLRWRVYSQVDAPEPRKYAARCQKLAAKDEERYFTDESYRDLASLKIEDFTIPDD